MEYAEKEKNVGLGELSWFGQKYIYWKSWQKEFKKKKTLRIGIYISQLHAGLRHQFSIFYGFLLYFIKGLTIPFCYYCIFQEKKRKKCKTAGWEDFPINLSIILYPLLNCFRETQLGVAIFCLSFLYLSLALLTLQAEIWFVSDKCHLFYLFKSSDSLVPNFPWNSIAKLIQLCSHPGKKP